MKSLFFIVVTSVLLAGFSYAECDANAHKLIKAYPRHLLKCEDNYIVWLDGFKQIYDDGVSKTPKQLLEYPDIQDMFAYKYKLGEKSYDIEPKLNDDPGRIRNTAFFERMYGKTKKQVQERLTTIEWMPQSSGAKLLVTTINDVDKKLQLVSDELDVLPGYLKKYVKRQYGTFNFRYINGTKRLSSHSFAIAIDINTKYANYWKWSKQYKYQNKIPKEIIKIFEKNGFIWGGKWYHYDTMHFEYRPEMLGIK